MDRQEEEGNERKKENKKERNERARYGMSEVRPPSLMRCSIRGWPSLVLRGRHVRSDDLIALNNEYVCVCVCVCLEYEKDVKKQTR